MTSKFKIIKDKDNNSIQLLKTSWVDVDEKEIIEGDVLLDSNQIPYFIAYSEDLNCLRIYNSNTYVGYNMAMFVYKDYGCYHSQQFNLNNLRIIGNINVNPNLIVTSFTDYPDFNKL